MRGTLESVRSDEFLWRGHTKNELEESKRASDVDG